MFVRFHKNELFKKAFCESAPWLLLNVNFAGFVANEDIAEETIPEDEVVHHVNPPLYRVLISGSAGVGKTTLQQQFMTSEYLGNVDYLPGKVFLHACNKRHELKSAICINFLLGNPSVWCTINDLIGHAYSKTCLV